MGRRIVIEIDKEIEHRLSEISTLLPMTEGDILIGVIKKAFRVSPSRPPSAEYRSHDAEKESDCCSENATDIDTSKVDLTHPKIVHGSADHDPRDGWIAVSFSDDLDFTGFTLNSFEFCGHKKTGDELYLLDTVLAEMDPGKDGWRDNVAHLKSNIGLSAQRYKSGPHQVTLHHARICIPHITPAKQIEYAFRAARLRGLKLALHGQIYDVNADPDAAGMPVTFNYDPLAISESQLGVATGRLVRIKFHDEPSPKVFYIKMKTDDDFTPLGGAISGNGTDLYQSMDSLTSGEVASLQVDSSTRPFTILDVWKRFL